MFIHWGIYALPARHEWVKNRERIRDEDYQRYFDHFYPDLYDPAEWARRARSAGMKYVVVTTKHHDGFCLWDSALTDYKVTHTPWGKDLLGPLVDALRAEGLKIGFYHSLIDWHHPAFPIDGLHPMRDDVALREAQTHRDNLDWKSTEMLVRMLVDAVSKGGNMLLNVGPNARGEFEPRAIERLRGIGDWMRLHNRSIYGCTASDLVPPPDCRYTQNGRRLYLHVFAWPFRHLHLDGLAGRVEYAQLLNDASEIKMLAIDPHKQAQNPQMGGLPPGTPTLELPGP